MTCLRNNADMVQSLLEEPNLLALLGAYEDAYELNLDIVDGLSDLSNRTVDIAAVRWPPRQRASKLIRSLEALVINYMQAYVCDYQKKFAVFNPDSCSVEQEDAIYMGRLYGAIRRGQRRAR